MLLLVLASGVAACRTAPVHDVVDAPLPDWQRAASTAQVDEAIWRAGRKVGWEIDRIRPGVLRGTWRFKRHVAVVRITHGDGVLNVHYEESENLRHDGGRIHENYNVMVERLVAQIQREPIAPLSGVPAAAAGAGVPTRQAGATARSRVSPIRQYARVRSSKIAFPVVLHSRQERAMVSSKSILSSGCLLVLAMAFAGSASATNWSGGCRHDPRPVITFVEFESVDLEQVPPAPLTVQGKLKLPVRWHGKGKGKCFRPGTNLAAVLILHGSAGVDARGDFYARALNAAGIATLEIDMWEARGIASAADRPPLPFFNYPDAFAALAFLSSHPNIDPERVGELGFSWGAVVTMASATELYATEFGGELRFRAHVAHYPVCYAYNSGLPGTDFGDLTGYPLMIGIGELDDYDEGSAPCFALKDSLDEAEQDAVTVVPYDEAFHAWDRLQVPIEVMDPFSHLGQGGVVVIAPNVDRAYESRRRVVRFFRRNL